MTLDSETPKPLLATTTHAMNGEKRWNGALNGDHHPATAHYPTNGDSQTTGNGHSDDHTSRHIWVVTGPAGCGKSTVAAYLQKELSIPYLEGDDFHSVENKLKMANNQPLTDSDRWDWLITLRSAAVNALFPSSPTASTPTGIILTCSALRARYRDVLRIAAYTHPSLHIHFVYLHALEAVLMRRVRERRDHYMKDTMVHSQMEVLEEPTPEEGGGDVIVVDVGEGNVGEVQRTVLESVVEVLSGYD